MSDIQSPDPLTRAKAIRAASERRDTRAIPLLVDRLEDEDSGVRFFAIVALERLTGLRMDYDYARPPEAQPLAIERWRAFAEARTRGPAPVGTDPVTQSATDPVRKAVTE